MKFNLRQEALTALIYNDKKNKLYTVYALEKGFPIVSDTTIEAAKSKFEEALKLSSAVRNLLYFEGSIKSQTEKTRKLYKNTILSKIGNVEYHEMLTEC